MKKNFQACLIIYKLLNKHIALYGLLFLLLTTFAGCEKNDVVSAGPASMSLKKFHDNLKASLDNNCVGYAFAISYNGAIQLDYVQAGGKKRTAANPPEADFSLYDPMAIASVSKEITAVAVIKAMSEHNPAIKPEDNISSYLPASWTQGNNIDKITFKNLLQHTSGFRPAAGTNVDINELKTLVAAGVSELDYGDQLYENVDFALFRYIIPEMLGKHNLTDEEYSAAYLQYCQQKIFDPISIHDVQLQSLNDNTQALSYPFPAGNVSGNDWGNLTLFCGSQGFNLSVWQLAVFQNKLWYTTQILSTVQLQLMKDNYFGLFSNGVAHSVPYWGHNGFYPYVAVWKQGQLWAQLMHFDNGVDVAVIVNSPIAVNGAPPVTDINGVTGLYIDAVVVNAFSASF